jgi:hypothetical protein
MDSACDPGNPRRRIYGVPKRRGANLALAHHFRLAHYTLGNVNLNGGR